MMLFNNRDEQVMNYNENTGELFDLNGMQITVGSLVELQTHAGQKLGDPPIQGFVEYYEPDVLTLVDMASPITLGNMDNITVIG